MFHILIFFKYRAFFFFNISCQTVNQYPSLFSLLFYQCFMINTYNIIKKLIIKNTIYYLIYIFLNDVVILS